MSVHGALTFEINNALYATPGMEIHSYLYLAILVISVMHGIGAENASNNPPDPICLNKDVKIPCIRRPR